MHGRVVHGGGDGRAAHPGQCDHRADRGRLLKLVRQAWISTSTSTAAAVTVPRTLLGLSTPVSGHRAPNIEHHEVKAFPPPAPAPPGSRWGLVHYGHDDAHGHNIASQAPFHTRSACAPSHQVGCNTPAIHHGHDDAHGGVAAPVVLAGDAGRIGRRVLADTTRDEGQRRGSHPSCFF